MKKNLFLIFLFCVNFIYAQDTASNKAFPKFLSSSSTNVKTFVDENGIETIIGLVSGQVIINNTTISVLRPSLMIFRHHIKDSMNYMYDYISDPAKTFVFSTLSDICKTKKGIGIIVYFASQSIYLKYPIYTVPYKYFYNSIYLEFDSFLGLTDYTKFGSNNSFSITKLVSDENENKVAFTGYYRDLNINDTTFLYNNGTVKYSIFSFKGNKVKWSYVFDTLNTMLIMPIQLASKKNELYSFMQLTGKNINYNGHLLSRTSLRTYSLLKLDSLGRYISDIETDSVNQLLTGNNSLLVSDDRVFLSICYTNYLKFGNAIYTQTGNFSSSLLCEMDTGLNIKNKINFTYASNGITNILKAYDEDFKLLYFDAIFYNSTQAIFPIVINDTIKYYTNFGNYPNYSQTNVLFSYSTIKKAIVSSYDFSVASNFFSNIYCPKGLNPKVYCDLFIYGNIKLEGKTILDATYRNFSFALNKPSVFLLPPYGFIAKRRSVDLTELVWVNNDVYDSIEVQKYQILYHKIEFTSKIKNSPVSYIDSTPSIDEANYYYKIRGYKNGEYSIWIGSDSTPTTAPLGIENYINVAILNNKMILLNWGFESTSVNNIYYRELYRSESRTFGFQRIAKLWRGTQSYIDSNVLPDKTYYYFVRDFNSMYDVTTDTVAVKLGGTLNFYSNYFQVYPNPCYDKMYFNLSDKSVKTFTVIDSRGRTMIFNLIESNGKYFADMSGLENGVYTISCFQFETLYTRRFVKL